MAVDASTPVSAIEGIRPAIEAGLARLGVFAVFDLLRGTTEHLHSVVKANASLADVESWKCQAALLQVQAVTPAWAAALVRAKVMTVDGLALKSVSAIAQILAAAPGAAAAPTADQIGEMLADASVLAHTGCIPGTVLDKKKKPIPGVTVRLGAVQTKTDTRGRFRLLRIRLGTPVPLRLEHPGYRTEIVTPPPISDDVATIGARRFQLTKGRPPRQPVLSELNGDVVPVPPGQSIKQKMVAVTDLRRGDILLLRELYQNQLDGQLVSRFKTFEDGTVLIRTVRVPLSSLPADPAPRVGNHFRWTGKTFVGIEVTPSDLHREKVVRRLTKEFADRRSPRTRKERTALIKEKLDYLMTHAFFVEERAR
ncbi:MAG TPA: carboxypeptidase-like regulatory domain-containing protein [Vicinamibacterales bacterium]|nr:carboxypeptidase-like regulatory domain-containing protein [Vicinamibacterales bacterium]